MMKRWTLVAALFAVGCGSDEAINYLGNPAQPPIAVADTFSVLENAALTGRVTSNDVTNGATVVSFQNASALGGTVTMDGVGQFTYTPPLNRGGVSDTFTYTLGNQVGNSTATVTVNITAGSRDFFVKNDVASSGDGSQASPFKTLAEAVAAANGRQGSQIIVFRGDGSNTGLNTPVALGTNQGISSQDATTPANITGPITLSQGNTVRNLRIADGSGGNGAAVDASNGSNATLSGLEIEAGEGDGITLSGFTGTLTVSNCSFRNLSNNALTVFGNGGNLVSRISDCTFANVTSHGIFMITSNSTDNVTVNNLTSPVGGTAQILSLDSNGTNRLGFNASNITVDGGGVGGGMLLRSNNSSNVVALLSANNITNCPGGGMLLIASNDSVLKSRLTANRLSGNAPGISFQAFGVNNANLGLILEDNVGDDFVVGQANANPTVSVELLDQFNAASNNTGSLTTTGTVINAPAGSLNIP